LSLQIFPCLKNDTIYHPFCSCKIRSHRWVTFSLSVPGFNQLIMLNHIASPPCHHTYCHWPISDTLSLEPYFLSRVHLKYVVKVSMAESTRGNHCLPDHHLQKWYLLNIP
jgi:hypothetical protein